MANFIFDEGAALAATTGLDWVGTDYMCAVYESPLVVTIGMTWADVSAAVIASEPMANKAITSEGACAADTVSFVDISPTENETLTGILIVRTSDNALIMHKDLGYDFRPNQATPGDMRDVLRVSAQVLTYTFDVVPGANNEAAWFRL